ncbi:hypothetical protein CH373_06890 [Leptospira perolatii]|uniref:Uncharacterized protein n=2 Tax=Leptospira perolatii TaxID=2023191 RepID=A0A2M9ZPH0_9LEPT|nr:hypothetical protein CH360_03750 [Leptospira perolatii]PJZ73869.1 hypothetical protein CH373_06890 [Leptospira perolatii]
MQTPANPNGECLSSASAAQICLNASADLSGTVTESVLSQLFSGSASITTYSQYCSALLSSDSFVRFSEKAKECVMVCNKEYWQDLNSQSLCGGQSADLISGSSTGTLSCIRICTSVSGP